MGFFGKLKSVLSKTRDGIAKKLNELFAKNKLGDEFYEDLEDILISSDVSVSTAMEIIDEIKDTAVKEKCKDKDYVIRLLKDELFDTLNYADKLQIKTPAVIMVIGVNGAGKTTSFYMITGLIVPNAGRIFLDDEDITSLPMFKRAQKGVGYLAQEASVFRHMSVEDNIMSVMEMSKQFTKAQRKERLESLLDEFNLHKVRKSKGIQLSGGERRRCEIARALAIDPKFILLDEPFAGVDPIAVEDIQYIIAKLKYKNIGVIITDHNVGETLAIIDRAYLLYEGSILQSGTPEELAGDEEVRTKYLGSNFVLKRSDAFLRAEAGGPQRINTKTDTEQ